MCPVQIDIPAILVHERARAVRADDAGIEHALLGRLARAFGSRASYERAQSRARSLQRPFARDGWITRFPPGPLAAWGRDRDLPAVPPQTFREWWEARERA